MFDALKDMTGGRGPDRCIDAVGMEAHGTFIDALYDKPSFLITHSVSLTDAPEMYRTFRDKQDACIKVVMRP